MKRHELDILKAVLFEGGERLQIDPSRSWKTIQNRYDHEGQSFLSIALPSMHDDFIEAVDAGRWLGSRLFGVSKGRPVFLREILQLVFNFGAAGSPLKEGDTATHAVLVIRQILLLFKKQKALPSASRSAKAVDSFFECERELKSLRKKILGAWTADHSRVCSILFGDVFSGVENDIRGGAYTFKHGPGTVAESVYGIRKYAVVQELWTKRLARVLPYDEVCYANVRHMLDSPTFTLPLSPKDERAMRVILVPKTQKTPRIIAAEQTVNQFVQQGLNSLLLNRVKMNPSLRSSIDWTDQSRQRKLARNGSVDNSIATLDLSEASDRVHVSLVSRMLRNHPLLRAVVFACRTTRANFSGRTIFLEKFAPMGSALCFPVETMVFTIICTRAVLREWRLPVSRKNVEKALRRLSLYGDDIIVPTETAAAVMEDLESFGLKINRRKSFWNGDFRESCGGDYFRGTDVTPVYLRYNLLDSRDPKSLAATVVSQNQFFDKGWFSTSDYLRNLHKRLSKLSAVPFGYHRGFMFRSFTVEGVRHDENLHCPVFTVMEFSLRKKQIPDPDGWDSLFDWMISSLKSPDPISQSHALDRRPDIHHVRFLPTPVYLTGAMGPERVAAL